MDQLIRAGGEVVEIKSRSAPSSMMNCGEFSSSLQIDFETIYSKGWDPEPLQTTTGSRLLLATFSTQFGVKPLFPGSMSIRFWKSTDAVLIFEKIQFKMPPKQYNI